MVRSVKDLGRVVNRGTPEGDAPYYRYNYGNHGIIGLYSAVGIGYIGVQLDGSSELLRL